MMVLEHTPLTAVVPVRPWVSETPSPELGAAELPEMLAADVVRQCHQTLQAAVLSDDDRRIGRALDALGAAYGLLHDDNRTVHYCAIATQVLQDAGDVVGVAIALHHTQQAAQRLQQG